MSINAYGWKFFLAQKLLTSKQIGKLLIRNLRIVASSSLQMFPRRRSLVIQLTLPTIPWKAIPRRWVIHSLERLLSLSTSAKLTKEFYRSVQTVARSFLFSTSLLQIVLSPSATTEHSRRSCNGTLAFDNTKLFNILFLLFLVCSRAEFRLVLSSLSIDYTNTSSASIIDLFHMKTNTLITNSEESLSLFSYESHLRSNAIKLSRMPFVCCSSELSACGIVFKTEEMKTTKT